MPVRSPTLARCLAAASQVIEQEKALAIIMTVLEHSVPNDAAHIEQDIINFLEHPELLGGFGLLVVLFFSSLAFRMLQEEECDIISNLKPEEYRLHAPAPT